MTQTITFFIDRCLGSKRIATALRNIGITVEIHSDYFDPDALDVDWLPEVGKRGWIVAQQQRQKRYIPTLWICLRLFIED